MTAAKSASWGGSGASRAARTRREISTHAVSKSLTLFIRFTTPGRSSSRGDALAVGACAPRIAARREEGARRAEGGEPGASRRVVNAEEKEHDRVPIETIMRIARDDIRRQAQPAGAGGFIRLEALLEARMSLNVGLSAHRRGRNAVEVFAAASRRRRSRALGSVPWRASSSVTHDSPHGSGPIRIGRDVVVARSRRPRG